MCVTLQERVVVFKGTAFQMGDPEETARKVIEGFRSASGGFDMDEEELVAVVDECERILGGEPSLLELSLADGESMVIVGDIHGHLDDLTSYLTSYGFFEGRRFLFLGDYVDRGSNSIEVMVLLAALKVVYPERVYLIRGNHETRPINELYGFFDECLDKGMTEFWEACNDMFGSLPLAATIQEANRKIFCVHGGLSKELTTLDKIREVKRPIYEVDEGLVADLLWSDPRKDGLDGWLESDRGISFQFGEDVVKKFNSENGIDTVVRAHEFVHGVELPFNNDSMVTLFSASNYYSDESNDGAIMIISRDGTHQYMMRKDGKFVAVVPERVE